VIDPAANTARGFATLRVLARSIRTFITELELEVISNRYAVLWVTTSIVMPPLDLLFLGFVARAPRKDVEKAPP
jgi:hypothetical protein